MSSKHHVPPTDIDQLEELISRPTEPVIATMLHLSGDLIVLGAGGKIGPSLARMAKRASDQAETARRVIAVSRFSDSASRKRLEEFGVETVQADLLDADQLNSLPDAENILYLAGHKFGVTDNPSLTWAMNSYLPGTVMQRYRESRVVAYSTGCVYGLSDLVRGGAVETDPLNPTDEYSMSCVGRERIIEYYSRTNSTPTSILRLNYAVEPRYGVLVDIAKMVLAEQPIDVTMGHCNVIWQGDANAMALSSLANVSSPPFVVNVVGPELLSVRGIAESFGRLFGKEVRFVGTESSVCLLTNGQRCHEIFGYPQVPVQTLIQWTADWLFRGEPTHNKPTGFQVLDGRY
ncbi:NAD(P)-dependent oxidoreductase [Novipirellula caenicola]|uniref:NAD-dependent epimerase/dehydratase domain-containing protein n=1 Tax=Novipirellula caenicola TaxID=1536901 RepID=A0ABP9VIF4_9BACT